MFNFTSFSFLCVCIVTVAKGRTIQADQPGQLFNSDEVSDLEQWLPHILDFIELLDIGKLMTVAMEYMDDPEVVEFAAFLTGPEFPKLIHEFESMDEFKEAFMFLESKGYNTEILINLLNSALDLPPFEKPILLWRKQNGISGLLQDIMSAVPVENMKKLFQDKLESSPEMAELFDTINSEEFVHILKKMSQNPKFKDIKKTFESYGFEFEIICAGAKEIFGENYQGIFCE